MTPQGIIIHCSDSPQGRGDDVSTIDRWNRERGFDRVGYHYVILEDGTIQKGRPDDISGAHAAGYNNYIGICLIGIDSFTDAQFNSLETLIIGLVDKYDFDERSIMSHYEVSTKSCPNFSTKTFTRQRKIF